MQGGLRSHEMTKARLKLAARLSCVTVKALRSESTFARRPKCFRTGLFRPEITARIDAPLGQIIVSLRPTFPTVSTPLKRGLASWLPSFGFPQGGLTFPVASHYSILILPPTLRAVRGCSLYVRIPINTFRLADFRRLPSGVPGQG